MPRNQFQRMVFAFITVVITVHAYVFYSIYVVNGDSLRQAVGTTSVLAAVRTIGGIYMFGRVMPVWSVVLVEFCFAYFMECAYGSPLSFKLACKNFDPKTTHPVLFETAIICATVGLTCAAQLLRDSLKMLHWSILPAYSRRSLGSCNEPDCNFPLLSLQQWISDSCRSCSVAAPHVL